MHFNPPSQTPIFTHRQVELVTYKDTTLKEKRARFEDRGYSNVKKSNITFKDFHQEDNSNHERKKQQIQKLKVENKEDLKKNKKSEHSLPTNPSFEEVN